MDYDGHFREGRATVRSTMSSLALELCLKFGSLVMPYIDFLLSYVWFVDCRTELLFENMYSVLLTFALKVPRKSTWSFLSLLLRCFLSPLVWVMKFPVEPNGGRFTRSDMDIYWTEVLNMTLFAVPESLPFSDIPSCLCLVLYFCNQIRCMLARHIYAL